MSTKERIQIAFVGDGESPAAIEARQLVKDFLDGALDLKGEEQPGTDQLRTRLVYDGVTGLDGLAVSYDDSNPVLADIHTTAAENLAHYIEQGVEKNGLRIAAFDGQPAEGIRHVTIAPVFSK